MTSLDFTILAAGLLGFALISNRLARSVVTAPMIFTLFGLLVGPSVLGLVNLNVENEAIHTLTELTLILVLFADATRIDLGLLRREHTLPVRMLAIGLPLTIALGTVIAMPLFGLNLWAAAVLATMLAPTDAALGQAVVSNPRVPVRIRQTLNAESGLNDGIVLPVLLIFLSLAGAQEEAQSGAELVRFTLMQVTLGPLVGLLVGGGGGWLLTQSRRLGWITPAFQSISSIALALLAFGAAELVGGNGFIAAFCAGIALGNFFPAACTSLHEFVETEGQLLTLLVFMIFGAALVPDALAVLRPSTILYAILSLTLIRMVPVAISLVGVGLQRETLAFLGWFGPRGLATVLFGLLVLDETMLAGRTELTLIAMATVLLSIFAHGLTAYPIAQWYGNHAETMQDEPDMPEFEPVTEMPLRTVG